MTQESIFSGLSMHDFLAANVTGYTAGPRYTCTKGYLNVGYSAWAETNDGWRTHVEPVNMDVPDDLSPEDRAAWVRSQSSDAQLGAAKWAIENGTSPSDVRTTFAYVLYLYEGHELDREPSSGWQNPVREIATPRDNAFLFESLTDTGEGVGRDYQNDFAAFNMIAKNIEETVWLTQDEKGISTLFGKDRWLAFSWKPHPLWEDDNPLTHNKSIAKLDQDGKLGPRYYPMIAAHFETKEELLDWMSENGVSVFGGAALTADIPEDCPDPDNWVAIIGAAQTEIEGGTKVADLVEQYASAYPEHPNFDWAKYLQPLQKEEAAKPPF